MTPLGISKQIKEDMDDSFIKPDEFNNKNAKNSRGRGAFYDKVVKVLVNENPRKTGTRAWHIFEILLARKTGISYEYLLEVVNEQLEYSKAAVREDVAHDLKKGRIELV